MPNTSNFISGVSLTSFLQMLEQDQKSCTLLVKSGKREGSFFFDEGILVDAEHNELVGLEAAHAIFAWRKTKFKIGPAQDERPQRIEQSLTNVLLTAAHQQDEDGIEDDDFDEEEAENPEEQLGLTISEITGVVDYYLLNSRGKVIAQSNQNQTIPDFITYCIMCGVQIRKTLDAKGPNRILLIMADTSQLLISSAGSGMIIGVILAPNTSVDDVAKQIAQAVKAD